MSCVACEEMKTGTSKYGEVILQTDNIIGVLMTERGASPGHCLFMPKEHHEKMHTVPDEILSELIWTVKKVANILELENYNVLQNNGALAFQTLFHVHFHLIPKTAEDEGLRYLRDSDLLRHFDNSHILEKLKDTLG